MATLTVPRAGARALPLASVTLTVVGYAAAVAALLMVVVQGTFWMVGPVALPLVWLVASSLAVRARPEHPGALLFAGLGAGHLVGFAVGLPVALDPGLEGWDAWTLNVVALLAYGLGFAAMGAFLATYPRGVASTRVERWFLRLSAPLVVLAVLVESTTASRVGLVAEAERTTMPAPDGLPLVDLGVPVVGLLPLLVIAGGVLLVLRGRRATGTERRQLTWAAGAAGLLALMLALSPVLGMLLPEQVQVALFLGVVAVVPFVLLAGLVRYRLMDVDVYVTRTLATGVVVAIVLAAYALVAAATADSRTATAAVVVAAALTGVPLLRLVSRTVDRWFSGGRVRGQALLRQLADSLATSSREDIASRTARTVAEGLDVAWVRVVDGDLVRVAGSPGEQEPSLTVPLVAGARTVGRLECGPRHGGWSVAEIREVELLCHQTALALRTADLSTRLAAQVEELQASRLRLVRAELDVRRTLERDLHDGVQQQVVALIAHLGALRVMLAADSPAGGIVATAQRQANLCLSDLRAVIGGVHPPVLLVRGAVAAVESRAGLLPVPVRVESSLEHRYPAETEAAAYYVVSEALTNVVKHAAASHAEVTFAPGPDGSLCVRVTDDGVGMPGEPGEHGPSALRDRVESLGGEVVVTSGPGGTCVCARLPTSGVTADAG